MVKGFEYEAQYILGLYFVEKKISLHNAVLSHKIFYDNHFRLYRPENLKHESRTLQIYTEMVRILTKRMEKNYVSEYNLNIILRKFTYHKHIDY